VVLVNRIIPLISTTPALRATPPQLRRGALATEQRKGGRDIKPDIAKHPCWSGRARSASAIARSRNSGQIGAMLWGFAELTTPSARNKVASRLFY
jgi:hypothetical protein